MKTCYYELLEVSSDATETELKKAYRKKALQLHPDKNPDNIEEANHKFSLVRAAYEVLSDPQERAWYDSHKNSILNDEEEEIIEGESYLPSLSTEEIYRFFNPGMYTNMDDSISGFYAVVSRIFERLAHEEVQHGKYNKVPGFEKYKDDEANSATDESYLKYPRFGNSKSSYVDNVRNFYNVWGSFQTAKNFNWKDEYRYSHAPDRRTRRLMERENKKVRDDARKDYNEAIKKYVNFIKKRDPRVKSGQEELQKLTKKKQLEEYQNQIRQQNLNKLKNMNDFNEQDWQKLDPEELKELEELLENEYDESTDSEFDEFEDNEDMEIHEFECIVCDKVFKNEQQFKIHEDSKKHKKNVRQLQWEMKQEGIDLGIDKHDEDDLSAFETASSNFSDDDDLDEDEEDKIESDELLNEEEEEDSVATPIDNSIDIDNLEVDDDIDEEEPAPVSSTKRKDEDEEEKELNPLEADLAKLMGKAKLDSGDEEEDDWSMDNKKKSKKNKKKKNATPSKESTPVPESITKSKGTEKCSVCGLSFESRNQLFNHVKAEGHAAPPPKSKSKKKNKRK
ncbi:conserved hypothetical protein [Candida tropicalis MYA-3404]|uniref:J protein JJJ1 n=1 Tax=Candida tropicalis (strain ATCC MYA-3404 / T1) TaxID=294747 RepID=C5M3Y8_CANTT|nr:conserved hypothetical protein [Candida tropicalis MYA-3404]EER36038.1 conserved hypothetical protein [Candida tropicalis MYA-3404]KAG4410155.1 hypothetical protein JTP64_000793 [Candida tropicalis]